MPAESKNSFGSRATLTVGDDRLDYFRLDAVDGYERLPFSLKVLLENLLRTEDGKNVTAEQINAIGNWDPTAEPDTEIQFSPARVVMQDFTGVPAVVDLATMREAVVELGGDATKINPLAPAELVIDHSVIADLFGAPDSFERNVELEYERNRERYQFLRWGQTAFDEFKVVPPGTGIVHQVNIEYLARVVFARNGLAYPDTLVGTDSHTTMVNGLGVLGWGVGGIEAEAAMLGQPVSMLIPKVVGFKLNGELPDGSTATDLVLTITEMLRRQGVVGKFVEFYGPGRGRRSPRQPRHHRQHEPRVRLDLRDLPDRRRDAELPALHRPQGRADRARRGLRQGATVSGTTPSVEPNFSETLELDLSTVEPSLAGPKRPQDRVPLKSAKPMFREAFGAYVDGDSVQDAQDEAEVESFPASDPASATGSRSPHRRRRTRRPRARRGATSNPIDVTFATGEKGVLDHGAVVIAAITSCTNTSNPSVMVGRRAAGQEGGRARPDPQAVGQDHARARVEGRHRLLRPLRTDALPREARLQPRRLRLHHLHRQLRPDHRRGVGGGERGRPRRHRGALGQPQLRGPDQPRRQDELPGLAAARRRVRAGRHDGHRPAQRPAGPGHRRPGLPARHLAVPAGGRGGRRAGDRQRDVRQGLRRRLHRRRALAGPADPRGQHVRMGRGLDLRPQAPVLRGHAGRAVTGHRHRRRPGAAQARRLGDDRPHQSGQLDQGRLPRRQVPRRARRRPPGLQLLRVPARQPRGDDPRDVREHPAAQPDRPRHRGRLHPRLQHRATVR